ncbi:MAG: hypothetical protein GX773_03325, partial [Chloroflexi bacterium]|nr:hypothetical protein [Chloroflexota bacterium]
VSESLIPVISSLFRQYAEIEPENRRKALLEIGDILSIPDLQSLPRYEQTGNKATFESKPAKSSTQSTPRRGDSIEPASQPEEQVVRSKVNTRLREIASKPMDDEAHGLEASVSVIRGVGEKQAAHLVKLGINKIKDLLYLFPRR